MKSLVRYAIDSLVSNLMFDHYTTITIDCRHTENTANEKFVSVNRTLNGNVQQYDTVPVKHAVKHGNEGTMLGRFGSELVQNKALDQCYKIQGSKDGKRNFVIAFFVGPETYTAVKVGEEIVCVIEYSPNEPQNSNLTDTLRVLHAVDALTEAGIEVSQTNIYGAIHDHC